MANSPSTHKYFTRRTIFIILFFSVLFLIQYSRLIFLKGILYSYDIRLIIYPWRVAAFHALSLHQPAIWTDYMYCGYPLGADFVTALFYPVNYIFFRFLPSPEMAFNYYILFHLFISVMGMYLYSRLLRLSPWACVFTTLCFSFGGFMVARLCQPTVFDIFCWLPWIVFCLELSFRRRKWIYSLLAGLIQGMVILGGHPHISLYIFAFSLLYILFLGWNISTLEKVGQWKFTAIQLFFFLFVSLGIGALLIFPARELILESYRGEKFSLARMTEGSVTWSSLIRLLFPFILGGPENYHLQDTSFIESMFYFGSFPLLLFFVSFLVPRKNNYERFYIGVSVISVLVAMGNNTPLYLLLSRMPVIQHMHAPGRATLFISFSLPLVAGFTLDKLLQPEIWSKNKIAQLPWREFYLFFLLTFCIGLILFLYSLTGIHSPFQFSLLFGQIYARDTLLRFIFLWISVSIFYVWIVKYRSNHLLYFWVILLTTLELSTMGWVLNQTETRAEDIAFARDVPDTVRFLKSDKSLYRIYTYMEHDAVSRESIRSQMNTLYGNISMLYDIRSFQCHSTTSFLRFIELMGLPEELWIDAPSTQRKEEFYKRLPILSMMNVKYIVTEEDLNSPLLTLVYTGSAKIYELSHTLPRCYFVGQWQSAQDKKQALELILSPQIDLQKTAVLEEPISVIPSIEKNSPQSTVSLDEISPVHLKIDCHTEQPGLVILSDALYPGWKATVDGQITPIYRANYLIRAVPVSAGTHQIDYVYDPFSYKIGFWIFAGTFVCIFLILIICLFRDGIWSLL